MRPSNRNILLVIGIVVAVVVTLTTLVFKDRQPTGKQGLPVPKKTSLNTSAQRVIEFIARQVDSPKVPQR
jgi:hypothetical protein